MLRSEENDIITHCGPGTPMGDLMRQYWIPAVGSDELVGPDCPPMRIRVLNENLIAFRTTSGKVGLIDDYCPHRGASLFFGRNEEDGLRCVYHGWKFDVTGQCVDMMSEPDETNYTQKVKTLAYPTQERGGIAWAYMGPRVVPPPLPDLEANMMLGENANVRRTLSNYNWLQGMENNTDTSHQAILHFGALTAEVANLPEFRERSDVRYFIGSRSPKFHVRDTEAGVSYGASRPADDDTYYWKTHHWLFPFYTMSPVPKLGSTAQFVATVPIDDYHCMSWSMTRVVGQMDGQVRGQSLPRQTLPNTTDWLGRFRDALGPLAEQDFNIDRDLQRAKAPTLQGFTGMLDVPTQDGAMQWSQGRADRNGIVDRSREHLGTTDSAIIRVRRRLLAAAKALREDGAVPPGVDNPTAYRFRSGWIVLPRNVDFWEGARELREAFRYEQPIQATPVS